jgi:hypothetical protein
MLATKVQRGSRASTGSGEGVFRLVSRAKDEHDRLIRIGQPIPTGAISSH